MIEPLDPPVVRRMKLQAWEDVQRRLARRAMKKAGILEDYDRAAIMREREDRKRRTELVRRLGAEAVAGQDEQTRRFNRWLRDGQRGPRPLLPGEEPTDQLVPDLAEGGPEPATEPASTVEQTAAVKVPGPHPVSATPPTQPKLLERRGDARKAQRKRELARRPTRPRTEPEVLPGGGHVHVDVLPVPVAEARRPGPEPIAYVGFDFDWTV